MEGSDELLACDALGDMCTGGIGRNDESEQLSGRELRQMLLDSLNNHLMHVSLQSARHVTLLMVARAVRTAPADQIGAAAVNDVLDLVVHAVGNPSCREIIFFTDDCSKLLLAQIEHVATSTQRASFLACNRGLLAIPVLRHPLNKDKQYEVLSPGTTHMCLEVESTDSNLALQVPTGLFRSCHAGPRGSWRLEARPCTKQLYEAGARRWVDGAVARGLLCVRQEHDTNTYDQLVQTYFAGDASRLKELPHMQATDPCNVVLGGKQGDIIIIRRFGEDGNIAYRLVV